ncbi:MAG: hypothetical protein ABIG56_04760 [Candidatus Omnitrophota bacterium]
MKALAYILTAVGVLMIGFSVVAKMGSGAGIDAQTMAYLAMSCFLVALVLLAARFGQKVQ